MVPDHQLTVAAMRAKADVPPTDVEPVTSVVDTTVPGLAGQGPVPVRITTPAAAAGLPVGVVVHLHGGGHVTGTVASYDGLTRRLANRVPATVVSVDYRRAPEHRCPAPVHDAHATHVWTVHHVADLAPGSGGRIAVAGDSAGGNNTAVLVRWLRDDPTTAQQPVLQVLIYPPVDAVAYRARALPSHTERGTGYGLVWEDGLAYWDHYLGPHENPAHPDASPLRAPPLAGLPPAYVLTAGYDVLRDEGRAYADAMAAAGVVVTHREWGGHLHGFLGDPAMELTRSGGHPDLGR